jgi:hypothetical protein
MRVRVRCMRPLQPFKGEAMTLVLMLAAFCLLLCVAAALEQAWNTQTALLRDAKRWRDQRKATIAAVGFADPDEWAPERREEFIGWLEEPAELIAVDFKTGERVSHLRPVA